MYTTCENRETKAIVELILTQIDNIGKTKHYGLGFTVVPLFVENIPTSVDIFKGTPRDLLRS
jgi:hypothetical protein